MDTKRFELTELKEKIAKWLFTNRSRFPNQRFYANWYDETTASPLTEREYLNLAGEVLSYFEPVELEALGDEELARIDIPLNISRQWMSARRYAENVMKHTIRKNQKGQLYRLREGN